MTTPSLPSSAELGAWREQLAHGTLPAVAVRQLLDAVEGLRTAAETAAKDALALASVAVAQRLSARLIASHCPACGDAEAHRATAWLRRAAGVDARASGA